MEEQSDTPRTDALLDDIRTQKVATRYRYVRMVRAAKQFERERDEARALNAEWGKKAETWMASPEAAQRLQGYRELAQQVATAQNERDEARAEVERLRSVLLGHVPHVYEGNCPDRVDPTQRDSYCPACRILAATEAP